MTRIAVEDFPDVQPLRDGGGEAIGLFSDHGSWLSLCWGAGTALEVVDTTTGASHPLDLGHPLERGVVWADRLDVRLSDGSDWRAGFEPGGRVVLESRSPDRPVPVCSLPVRVLEGRGAWRVLVGPDASSATPPPDDLFERNRGRWNEVFALASRGLGAPDLPPAHRRLLARSLTVLLWNRRGPMGSITHSGVIPSPFAYPGHWAWDSWKHAHALAVVAPELAAESLRVQLSRQRPDGMVPDTVFPDPARDNGRNTKPPMAAWALLRIVQESGDHELARELLPRCAGQMRWFETDRRLPDEVLFRAGGVDHETAAWDTGWDDSARFVGVSLEPHGEWRLFDLWQPDYNAHCLGEYRALARLAELLGEDPSYWQDRARRLASAIADTLWDAARGWFCDVRPSTGVSTGIRSAAGWTAVRAGAARPDQAAAVRALLRSPSHFDTPLPFPTLATSEPAFDPDDYWNGSVWLDHALWAIEALGEAARDPSHRLLGALSRHDALYECYSPLTAEPAAGGRPAVPQFSWTAASLLSLLMGWSG